MYPPDVINWSISRMEDLELLRRWHGKQFSEVATPIAENELRARGIDPSGPGETGKQAAADPLRQIVYSVVGAVAVSVLAHVVAPHLRVIEKVLTPLLTILPMLVLVWYVDGIIGRMVGRFIPAIVRVGLYIMAGTIWHSLVEL